MIKIETAILEEEDGSCVIGFNANDQEGCTRMEGDIADVFRKVLTLTRDKVLGRYGFNTETVIAQVYKRTFEDPEERDAHATGVVEEEMKQRANALMERDRTMVASIVQASFLAGMQLSIRICRNRAEDIRAAGKMMTMAGNEADNCAGIIRLTQVEIGAGRMARPQFTKEELEEMDRIA